MKRVSLILSWIFYATVLLLLAHGHAPWFDEAQAWLIARDNSLFDILFHRMHYEGSPALWHILLWVLVRLGVPYAAIGYLSVILALVAGAIFLRFAPFPVSWRVVLLFGYFPAFQYSVIARSYSLSLPLVIIVAALFASRIEKPLRYCVTLALLANTNAFSFLLAGAIFCEFLWDIWRLDAWARKYYWPVIIFLGAAFLAALEAVPASDVRLSEPWFSLGIASRIAIQILVSFVQFHTPRGLAGGILVLSQLLLSVGALCLTFYLARRASHEKLMLAIFGALVGFGTFKYFSVWNAGIIYLAWIFILWISWPALTTTNDEIRQLIVVAIAFVWSTQFYCAVVALGLSFNSPYSAAPVAAAKLHGYFRDKNVSSACLGLKALAVEPYFDRNICGNYYSGSPRPSYYDWKRDQPYSPVPDVQTLNRLMSSGQFNLYLVSDMSIRLEDAEAVGRKQGYCISDSFPGHLIWKDDFYENDGLIIFRRCRPSLSRID